jgi:hypothetical protein
MGEDLVASAVANRHQPTLYLSGAFMSNRPTPPNAELVTDLSFMVNGVIMTADDRQQATKRKNHNADDRSRNK